MERRLVVQIYDPMVSFQYKKTPWKAQAKVAEDVGLFQQELIPSCFKRRDVESCFTLLFDLKLMMEFEPATYIVSVALVTTGPPQL